MTQETKVLGILGGIMLLIVFGGAFLVGGKSGETPNPSPITDTSQLVVDYAPTRGSKDAKVTLVEFSDYQCPACGAAYADVEKIVNEYGDKIYFVYRQFPLPMHKNAKAGAYAAIAAGKQNKYWEMHVKLFENQAKWAEEASPVNTFAGYAKDLGLNEDQFRKDMASNEVVNLVNEEISKGNALGVNSTPTFFINGQAYPGVLTYTQMKSMIDIELAR
jgi:protein-disulfide isomerase